MFQNEIINVSITNIEIVCLKIDNTNHNWRVRINGTQKGGNEIWSDYVVVCVENISKKDTKQNKTKTQNKHMKLHLFHFNLNVSPLSNMVCLDTENEKVTSTGHEHSCTDCVYIFFRATCHTGVPINIWIKRHLKNRLWFPIIDKRQRVQWKKIVHQTGTPSLWI